MKLKISLASQAGFGAVASIETSGPFGGDIDVAGDMDTSPAKACADAAKALRAAADRFDVLATQERPLSAVVQRQVNAAKPAPTAKGNL